MKTIRLLPLAAAAVSLAASAQSARPLPAVADPAAPVAPLTYQSVFSDSGKRTQDQATPDQLWIGANQQVAGGSAPGAHAGHAGHAMAPSPTAAAAKPVAEPVSKPAASKHDGHHAPAKEK